MRNTHTTERKREGERGREREGGKRETIQHFVRHMQEFVQLCSSYQSIHANMHLLIIYPSKLLKFISIIY